MAPLNTSNNNQNLVQYVMTVYCRRILNALLFDGVL